MSKALATKNIAAVLLFLGMVLSVYSFATPANETRSATSTADVIGDNSPHHE